MSIGVTKWDFFHSTPNILFAYEKAHEQKLRTIDELAWQICGSYVANAVFMSVDKCLFGKKSKAKYMEAPILTKLYEEINMTEEELNNKKIQEMIMAEEQWILKSRSEGLPETIIV